MLDDEATTAVLTGQLGLRLSASVDRNLIERLQTIRDHHLSMAAECDEVIDLLLADDPE